MTEAEKRLLEATIAHGIDGYQPPGERESMEELRRLVIYERVAPEHIAEARRLHQLERAASKARVEFVRKVSLPDVVWRQLQEEVRAEERKETTTLEALLVGG